MQGNSTSERQIFGGPILWQPTPEVIERAHLTAFMRHHDLASFDELYERSIQDIPWFTGAVLDYLGIQFQQPYSEVLDTKSGIAWAKWCVDGRLNIVETCLDRWVEGERADATALIWEDEGGKSQSLSFTELNRSVCRFANGLRELGYAAGDRIGIYMPMTPEIVIALLAIAKIGAIALPLFSGYGTAAISSRLEDANATGLITADGFRRRGKMVQMIATARDAIANLPQVRHLIIHRYTQPALELQSPRDVEFAALIAKQADKASTTIMDAESPLMILYTSGTTGRPKGALHTHIGFPVKAAQDMAFGTDVQAGDVIYWMTDMGWMMGPWLVFGALILGATLLLYDGAPDYPDHGRVWSLCDRHRINVLGLSPTLIRSLMAHGSDLPKSFDLSHLRCFGSTGEPWNPAPWRWLFDEIGEAQKPIINYSGGTEISGGILMGNPLGPLRVGAFSAPCPGIWADVFDDDGESLVGEVGELVIRAPWIGMTRGFLNDDERYERTYWSRWPDVWVHGDFALKAEDGSWYILGRSDDTLKVAGKRIGPAEIESILVQIEGVKEAAVIGIPDDLKGSSLVVFCVLNEGAIADQALADLLIKQIIQDMGKPLAPKALHFINDLPKTRNAKVMRRMLRSAYLGKSLGDTSALVNPECLDEIRRINHRA